MMRSDDHGDEASFAAGMVRIEGVVAKHKLRVRDRVLTSRDSSVRRAMADLPVRGVPDGFVKHQLPFVMDRSQFSLTEAEPGATVGEHSHGGDTLRIVVRGSVTFNGTELTPGDWLFIPGGVRYALEVGRQGAVMCGGYCCCCVPKNELKDWVVQPGPELFH